MTLKKLTLVSFRIILVFLAGIIISLIGDYLHNFLGDWKCQGSIGIIKDSWRFIGCNYGDGFHNSEWHWGWRHWLLFAMGFCLFIIQAFDIILFINKKDK